MGAFRNDADGPEAHLEAAYSDHRRWLRRCHAAPRGSVRYGFNRDLDATKDMLQRPDAAFAKAGKALDPDFQIIITPPVAMPIEAMAEYAELGVHRDQSGQPAAGAGGAASNRNRDIGKDKQLTAGGGCIEGMSRRSRTSRLDWAAAIASGLVWT
jgi:hypothetical protein